MIALISSNKNKNEIGPYRELLCPVAPNPCNIVFQIQRV